MPHFNLMIGPDGPVIEVAVAVGLVWRQELVIQGVAPPAPVTLRALIDTGADITAIHPQVLQKFGGRPVGSVRIRRPGPEEGYQLALTTEVQLSIGGVRPGAPWIPMQVAGVAPSTPTILALLGRDILKHYTMFHNGPRSEVTLSC